MSSVISITAVEGPLLTLADVADGTQLSGTTVAGATVEVTLTNGDQTLTRAAIVVGTDFTLDLSAADLEQLGEGAITYSAEASDSNQNVLGVSAAGALYYVPHPFVDSDVRIDGAGNYMPYDDDDAVSVVALSGGGFAVQWLADTSGDDDADTLAIQRYDATGAKVGDVVLLQGLPDALTNDEDHGAEAVTIDLTALDNGGYALTYAMQLTETNRTVTMTGNGQPISIPIAGRPGEINIVNAPPGATYFLQGTVDGSPVQVELTIDDGEIEIPRELFDQFTVEGRYSIVVQGVGNGQQLNLGISSFQTRLYDEDSVLQTEAVSATVANGSALLVSLDGRVEAFDIASPPAGATYTLLIVPAFGPQSVNLAGISGAFVLPTGVIGISGLQPDANGVIAVPQAILDQLDGDDATILLSVGGLANGTVVNADLSVREAIPQAEGIFVQTFDANGMAVTDDLILNGTDGEDNLAGDVGDDELHGGASNDVLDGGPGFDKLFGDGDNDTLKVDDPLVAGEVLDGGAGTDKLVVAPGAGIAVTTILGSGHQVQLFNATLSSIEQLEFDSEAANVLTATIVASQLGAGLSSTAELIGGEGIDQLVVVASLPGTYTVPTFVKTNWNGATEQFAPGDSVILVGVGFGNFTLNASAGHTGIETLIGGMGNDTLNGTDGMEVLNGGGGLNTLNGGGGNDVLVAANVTPVGGATTLFNFAGSQFNGGDGFDYLSVGGQVFFQGTLNSIEGIALQPAFTATAAGQNSQAAAELWLDAAAFDGDTPQLPSALSLRGEGTLVIDMDPGDSFDGSAFVFEADSDVQVRIEGSDGAAGDVIIGTSHDDLVDGQGGQDTAVFAGNRADYTASSATAGTVNIAGTTTGDDTFVSVELYRFDDGTYYWSNLANNLVLAESGVAFDGYLSGATVFIDVNNNDVLDEGEAFAITDENGDFTIGSDAVGPLKAIGGTNIDTGLPNQLVLSAPDDSTVINPLTTLVQALVDENLTEAEAEAQVKLALGLDDSIDLTTFDILGAAQGGDPLALDAQKAAASVAVILDTVHGSSAEPDAAVDSALGVLVTKIQEVQAPEDALDLADSDLLDAVVAAALPNLDDDEASALVGTTQSVNQAIEQATTTEGISEVQGNVAPVVANAIPDQDLDEHTAWNFQFASDAFSDENGEVLTYSYVVVDDQGDPLAVQPEWIDFDPVTRTFSGTPPLNFGGTLRIKVTAADAFYSVSDTFVLTIDREIDTIETNEGEGANLNERIANAYQLPADAENVTGTGNGQGLRGNDLDNIITAGAGADYINASDGGSDTVSTHDGRDVIYYGASLDGTDANDAGDEGGDARGDLLVIQGDYSAGVTLGGSALVDVEKFRIQKGEFTNWGDTADNLYSYDITSVDANVVAGGRVVVQGGSLQLGEHLRFDGSAETDGSFQMFGGHDSDELIGGAQGDHLLGRSGDDTLTGNGGADRLRGGLGGDTMNGGAGADIFVYAAQGGAEPYANAVLESTGLSHDTIIGFDFAEDKIDLPGAVSSFDNDVTGTLNSATFDADLASAVNGSLAANGAVLFTADNGDQSDNIFLVIDADGNGSYQADLDFVIELEDFLGTPPTSPDFFM